MTSQTKYEEGDKCPSCDEGVLEWSKDKPCYCHIVAPCMNCLSIVLVCSYCGEEIENDN